MNPLSLIPGQGRLLAAGVALAALVAGYMGWHHHVFAAGQADIQTKWDAAEKLRAEAEKAAVLKREQENEAEKEKQRENNRLLQKSYESEIARLRAAIDAAPRLRVGPSWCSGATGQTQASGAGGSNGADTGGRVLSPEVDRAVKQLIEETERAAAAGRACQQFLRDNGMAP
jgi:hypothetical protein